MSRLSGRGTKELMEVLSPSGADEAKDDAPYQPPAGTNPPIPTPPASHGQRFDAKDYNPYQPPAVEPDEPGPAPTPGSHALASHGQRFVAALIDALILSAILFPLRKAFGVWTVVPKATHYSPLQNAIWAGVYFVVYVVVQGFFLVRSSQTLGKRAMKIRIVRVADARPAPAGPVLLVRQLPQHVVGAIPVVGAALTMLDICFIFRDNHRCLHDELARTEVRRVN